MKRREFITLLAVGSCLAHCFARAADERTVRWWGYSHDIQTGYLIEARAAAGASQGVNGRGRQMARTTYVLAVAVGLLAAVISSNINGAFAIDDCLVQPPTGPRRALVLPLRARKQPQVLAHWGIGNKTTSRSAGDPDFLPGCIAG
jgi:hypothetical protein